MLAADGVHIRAHRSCCRLDGQAKRATNRGSEHRWGHEGDFTTP